MHRGGDGGGNREEESAKVGEGKLVEAKRISSRNKETVWTRARGRKKGRRERATHENSNPTGTIFLKNASRFITPVASSSFALSTRPVYFLRRRVAIVWKRTWMVVRATGWRKPRSERMYLFCEEEGGSVAGSAVYSSPARRLSETGSQPCLSRRSPFSPPPRKPLFLVVLPDRPPFSPNFAIASPPKREEDLHAPARSPPSSSRSTQQSAPNSAASSTAANPPSSRPVPPLPPLPVRLRPRGQGIHRDRCLTPCVPS